MYQNCSSRNSHSSSKTIVAYCFDWWPCTSFACCRCANSTIAPEGNRHVMRGLCTARPRSPANTVKLSSQIDPPPAKRVLCRRNTTAAYLARCTSDASHSNTAKLFPDPAAPP